MYLPGHLPPRLLPFLHWDEDEAEYMLMYLHLWCRHLSRLVSSYSGDIPFTFPVTF